MIIDGDWKNKVRDMRAMKNHNGAKKELRKAKMSKEYLQTSDKNRIFIDYCLAHYSFVEKNFDLSNVYLKDVSAIFENDENKKIELEKEYCNFLWLYVDVNHKSMNMTDVITNMTKVYEYYCSIKEKDIAISALVNVFRFQVDEERILEGLNSLLKCDKISDWNFVSSIINDCENINHNLYIKALSLVSEYKIQFNIDAV